MKYDRKIIVSEEIYFKDVSLHASKTLFDKQGIYFTLFVYLILSHLDLIILFETQNGV